ncbi:hypothetical protein Q604_UNBC17860G0001, partial [human gut metagenome]
TTRTSVGIVFTKEFKGAIRYLKKGYTDESIPKNTDKNNANE